MTAAAARRVSVIRFLAKPKPSPLRGCVAVLDAARLIRRSFRWAESRLEDYPALLGGVFYLDAIMTASAVRSCLKGSDPFSNSSQATICIEAVT